MAFGEAGVNNRFERGMAFDEMQAQNEALRAEGQRVFEATSTLRDEYQPQLDRYSDFIAENDGINTLLADIREMNPAERDLWIKSQDAVAAQAQLAEAQERQFTAWITENKPAGDAPSAEEIERLPALSFSGGSIVDMFTNKQLTSRRDQQSPETPEWSAGSTARGSIPETSTRPSTARARASPAIATSSRLVKSRAGICRHMIPEAVAAPLPVIPRPPVPFLRRARRFGAERASSEQIEPGFRGVQRPSPPGQ